MTAMFEDVVVCVEGDAGVGPPLAVAAALARASKGTVHVLCVVDTYAPPYIARLVDVERLTERAVAWGRRAALEAVRIARGYGAERVEAHVFTGVPGVRVSQFLEGRPRSVLVVGTHAYRGVDRLMLGSFAGGMARSASVPVVTVRLGGKPASYRIRRILLAADGSIPGRRAAKLAGALARAAGADVDVLHVIGRAGAGTPDPGRDPIAGGRVAAAAVRALLGAGVRGARAYVQSGDPARRIAAWVRSRPCDLVVMGTHARRGLPRLFLGSVAQRVLRESRVPVMTVRSGGKA